MRPRNRSPRPTSARGGEGRRGFSLIELLIVVAIIAALVGVAVPFFQGYLRDSRSAKLDRDLDLLVGAIQRFEFRRRALLTGGKLAPLVGETLQEIPADPWGNSYLLDGGLGVVGSLGADGVQGGQGEDEDRFRQYQRHLDIRSVSLSRPEGGYVRVGDRWDLQLSKPFRVEAGWEHLVGQEIGVVGQGEEDFPIPVWWLGLEMDVVASQPEEGYLALRCQVEAPPGANFPVSPGDTVVLLGGIHMIQEQPAPPEDSGIEDPGRFFGGPPPVVDSLGRYHGARIGS